MASVPNFYAMTLNHACDDRAGDKDECVRVHDSIRMMPFRRDCSAVNERYGSGLDLPDAGEEYIFR